ncbi:MAG: fibrillarin-like rRNA/tRNA 2'-O-methyltransferase [Euryarchaeota archaeon]|nr:fibrillarin-like rRNA/tRNA 2'-O-methyltransferase [Euryarchaeota archaeon]
MKRSRYPGVFTDGRHFYTLSNYGKSVYGEKVIKKKGKYYHLWNPRRSKLSASMHLKLKSFPFAGAKILYLGASTGTTVSHVSDLAEIVYAVEVSPISMQKLVSLAEQRKNIFPILEDARKVENFAIFVEEPDIIYQDVSQRDQVEIFIKNMSYFNPNWGFIMLKTRTIDMRRKPREIMKETVKKIKENFTVVEILDISRFQKDHYAIVVRA